MLIAIAMFLKKILHALNFKRSSHAYSFIARTRIFYTHIYCESTEYM